MFSNSFTWDSTNQKYVLSDDRITKWRYDDLTELNNHHYTCNNTTGTCSKVRYYYYKNYYIELDGAENIQAAVNEMLYNDYVNTYNSSKSFPF